jgi:hypothetical protein
MTRATTVSIWISTLLAVATIGRGMPNPPLQPGEQLRYRVSWAVVIGAGEINVRAEADPTNPDQSKITTTTSTRGLARLALPFDATAESIFNVKTGKLQSLHERSHTRNKYSEHMVTFDYPGHQALYANVGDTKTRAIAMPDGSPTDLITALLVTRTWDLKPGDARDALVLFNDEFYELTIHALRYEDVTTGMGSFKTLVLEPRMEKTPPKGMFKKGSTVQVWIAQDAPHLPIKFEVEFNIGTGTATLDHYEAPQPVKSADAKSSGS